MWTKSNNDFALGQSVTNDSNGSMVWSHEKKSWNHRLNGSLDFFMYAM